MRSRTRSYNWLANRLNMPKSDCHIGQFDAIMCKRVIEVTKEYIRKYDQNQLS